MFKSFIFLKISDFNLFIEFWYYHVYYGDERMLEWGRYLIMLIKIIMSKCVVCINSKFVKITGAATDLKSSRLVIWWSAHIRVTKAKHLLRQSQTFTYK